MKILYKCTTPLKMSNIIICKQDYNLDRLFNLDLLREFHINICLSCKRYY